MSLGRITMILSLVFLAGCASLPNRFSTKDTEAARSGCLEQGWVWVETADRYGCFPPQQPPART